MPAIYQDSLMRPVPWLAAFGIDDGQIDAEHRDIIALYNDICIDTAGSALRGLERVMQEDAIGRLTLHFDTEERIFEQIDFRDAVSHRREHNRIRKRLAPLAFDLDALSFTRLLLNLRTGLVEHIIRHDLGFKSPLLAFAGR